MLVCIRRHGLSVAKRIVCPSRGRGVIAHPKREVAAFLQEVRPLDRGVRAFKQRSRLDVMRLRLVSFAGVPQQSAKLAKYPRSGGAVPGSVVSLQDRLIVFVSRVTPASRPTQVGNSLV